MNISILFYIMSIIGLIIYEVINQNVEILLAIILIIAAIDIKGDKIIEEVKG